MTISLCMIVKNEERVLARCLDTVADLCDEIVIVDTGSTDSTKAIAAGYTDKIYDFQWVDDFSAARNFAFSLCSCDYIYSADADEVLDEENRKRFAALKENILPEIEIVQMKYGNQLSFGTVYNFDEEYRPKLFKRLRSFTWIEPVHEQVRLDPVVFDSDIVITHMPENHHGSRDFGIFLKTLRHCNELSPRLWDMYARELYMSGESKDFEDARDFFVGHEKDRDISEDVHQVTCLIAAKAARLASDDIDFFKYAMKLVAGEGCSEICYELGLFYEEKQDWEEARLWFYNAAFETTPVVKALTGGKEPLEHLIELSRKLGDLQQTGFYENYMETKL